MGKTNESKDYMLHIVLIWSLVVFAFIKVGTTEGNSLYQLIGFFVCTFSAAIASYWIRSGFLKLHSSAMAVCITATVMLCIGYSVPHLEIFTLFGAFLGCVFGVISRLDARQYYA